MMKRKDAPDGCRVMLVWKQRNKELHKDETKRHPGTVWSNGHYVTYKWVIPDEPVPEYLKARLVQHCVHASRSGADVGYVVEGNDIIDRKASTT